VQLLLGPYRRRKQIVCESDDNVRIRAQEQECLEALSENRKRRHRCDMVWQIVLYCSAGNWKRATADCCETLCILRTQKIWQERQKLSYLP